MAMVAALVGEPARANMLAELLDGRALTAGELARASGVTPPTASEHLARLTEARLLTRAVQGRHRYYRLASASVAAMLEAIIAVAPPRPERARAAPRIPPELKKARTCYDHIAGELGVGVADRLLARNAVILAEDGGEVTEAGDHILAAFGLSGREASRTRRVYCRSCLDWSERRPHIAGVLGARILSRSLELGWVTRAPVGRALSVTRAGQAGYRAWLGLEV